jgi:hypothetical protein
MRTLLLKNPKGMNLMTLSKQAGLGLMTVLISMAAISGAQPAADTERTGMDAMESADELKVEFNADAGKRRLLLLLSPT